MGNINACMDSYGSHKMSRARARVCVCVCVCVSERVRIFGCSLKPQGHIPNLPLSAVCNSTLPCLIIGRRGGGGSGGII